MLKYSSRTEQFLLMINDAPVAILPPGTSQAQADQALANLREKIKEYEADLKKRGQFFGQQYAHLKTVPVIDSEVLPSTPR